MPDAPKELGQTNDRPERWTFRTKPFVHEQTAAGYVKRGKILTCQWITTSTETYRETTVKERLAFDARRKAAQILGVDPLELEHVK